MITLTLPTGTTVTVNDSARTLPESRRVEHDYYSLIESGLGSSIADIDRHFETLLGLVGAEPEQLLAEVNNTRFLFYNLLERQYSPASLAFACLVDSIDGVSWNDYSPEGVGKLVTLLSERGLTTELLETEWITAKKKSMKT